MDIVNLYSLNSLLFEVLNKLLQQSDFLRGDIDGKISTHINNID